MAMTLVTLFLTSSTPFSVVPGQDFCTWNGEDMTRVAIPVAEINSVDFENIHTDLLTGGQVLVQLTSEGMLCADLI